MLWIDEDDARKEGETRQKQRCLEPRPLLRPEYQEALLREGRVRGSILAPVDTLGHSKGRPAPDTPALIPVIIFPTAQKGLKS